MSTQIDIIGGGASGLACAWYLTKRKADIKIRVWEKDPNPGGLAGSFQTEAFQVEKFYHHIFKRDHAIQKLIQEMGLQHLLHWRPAATGSYYFNQPYRLSSPLDVLRFKPLPLWDRLRLGSLVLHARTVRDWEELDDESVKEYICRVAGKKVYEVVWEPLLKGKFGPDADEISAAWLWSKLVDRGGSRDRKGFEKLGYIQGGMGRLFARLRKELIDRGHKVFLQAPVTGLQSHNGQINEIHTILGSYKTDLVIAANQVPDLIPLLPAGFPDYERKLRKVRYLGNVCLVLSLSKPLSQFYWTNVTDPQAPFVGIVEQTNWADAEDFQNQHLVYISAYVPEGDFRQELSAEALLDYYMPYVNKIFPKFRKKWVLDSWCWKADYAQPIVMRGYRHLIPQIRSPWPNLLLCTMAQIYPSDRQVSNGIELAERLVSKIRLEQAENHFSF